MKQYKVLSINEPWATLVVHGIKKIETRPSKTRWIVEKDLYGNVTKGTYLIYATKKWTVDQLNTCFRKPFFNSLYDLWLIENLENRSILKKDKFNFGHIIGAVDVVECVKIPKLIEYTEEEHYGDIECDFYISYNEFSFGNYKEGRYAWILRNPRILKNPIPHIGQQGYYQDFKGDVNQLIFEDDR